MNADATPTIGWSFVCLLPVLLVFVVGVAVGVVLLTMRLAGGRADLFDVSRTLKRILAVGIPLVLFALGVFCTAMLADRGPQPAVASVPVLMGMFLAAGTAIGLGRWAFPGWWGRAERVTHAGGPRLATRPSTADLLAPWRKPLSVFAVVLIGLGLLGVLFAARDGQPRSEVGVLSVFAVVVGGGLFLAASPRLGTVGPRQQKVSFVRFVFSKTGAGIFLLGVLVAVVVAVFTEKTLVAKLCGSAFIVGVWWWKWSKLRSASAAAPEPVGLGVAPLLLTPDPTAVRGDCPTCLNPIPADSPHGLCPRCLIRGAMPSPTSTRLRGVGPINPPTPAEVNEFFPHLEVLELIGAGGMGAVYKVRQPTLDRIVALKIVQSPRGDEDPVFAERFAREARAMAKLDHPSIVTIHESGEAGGLPFLLMEYVDGVTLREAMANRLLTAPEALAVIPQVCDALDYAHRAGVVHRDIKPENILLDQTGRVKIADFGLAKLADPKNVTLTRTQQAMGTPHYMAPEQWERPNEVDHRADIYALGVVLYELLTGELPLGRFALPSEKGKGDTRLDQVVVKALAKDVGERYQNTGQMKAALSGVKLAAFTPSVSPKRKGFEYKSKARVLGLPLVHVVSGPDPLSGRPRVAKGWIAVGDVTAVGGIAVGGVAGVGAIGVGGVCGLGLISLGGVAAVGLLGAVGGTAAGLLFAVGGCAASTGLSIGGVAAGKFAIGGQAGGDYVISADDRTPGFGAALRAWLGEFWPG